LNSEEGGVKIDCILKNVDYVIFLVYLQGTQRRIIVGHPDSRVVITCFQDSVFGLFRVLWTIKWLQMFMRTIWALTQNRP